jgi:hypothetical protein
MDGSADATPAPTTPSASGTDRASRQSLCTARARQGRAQGGGTDGARGVHKQPLPVLCNPREMADLQAKHCGAC